MLTWAGVILVYGNVNGDAGRILPVSGGSRARNSLGTKPSRFPCSASPLSWAINII